MERVTSRSHIFYANVLCLTTALVQGPRSAESCVCIVAGRRCANRSAGCGSDNDGFEIDSGIDCDIVIDTDLSYGICCHANSYDDYDSKSNPKVSPVWDFDEV